MKKTAVIMAGGQGQRFWPQSRKDLPKQFLSVVSGKETMIQLTVKRLLPMMDFEDIFIVTNTNYLELVRKQIPEIPVENILTEPVARDTAPAIGFAAAIIAKKYGDAIMMVLASDHLIKNEEIYLDTMELASKVALENENLVTIGITPTYPETGYGYINFGSLKNGKNFAGAYQVKRFVEKPNLAKAKEYLSGGDYLWNSGMFVWKVSTIMSRFKELLPDTYKGLLDIQNAFGTDEYLKVLKTAFESFKSESIDYAIMERAAHIYTIPGNFGWDDVGSWLALERINTTNEDGNVVQGDVITLDTTGSTIVGSGKFIATIGLEDVIIVDTKDALLICQKNSAQDVKKIIEHLKIFNRDELL